MAVLGVVCICTCLWDRDSQRATKTNCNSFYAGFSFFFFTVELYIQMQKRVTESPNISKAPQFTGPWINARLFPYDLFENTVFTSSIHPLPRESQLPPWAFIHPALTGAFLEKTTWIGTNLIEHIPCDKACSKVACMLDHWIPFTPLWGSGFILSPFYRREHWGSEK